MGRRELDQLESLKPLRCPGHNRMLVAIAIACQVLPHVWQGALWEEGVGFSKSAFNSLWQMTGAPTH